MVSTIHSHFIHISILTHYEFPILIIPIEPPSFLNQNVWAPVAISLESDVCNIFQTEITSQEMVNYSDISVVVPPSRFAGYLAKTPLRKASNHIYHYSLWIPIHRPCLCCQVNWPHIALVQDSQKIQKHIK